MTNKQILIILVTLFFVLFLFFISRPQNIGNGDLSISPTTLPPQGYAESVDTFVYNFYIQKYPNKVPRVSVGYNSSNIAIGYANIEDKRYLWLIKYENSNWVFVQETEDYLDCSLIDKLTDLPNVINQCRDSEGNIKSL